MYVSLSAISIKSPHSLLRVSAHEDGLEYMRQSSWYALALSEEIFAVIDAPEASSNVREPKPSCQQSPCQLL